MDGLFLNKIIGAALAACLTVFGLNLLSEGLYHNEAPEELAYAVEIDDVGGPAPVEEGPPDLGALLRDAVLSAGERVARKCVACHTFEAGAGNMTGPPLYDVMGREVAALDFGYSGAMQEYAEGGTQWLFQNMYDYLENPRGYVPGTAMSFAGLRKREDRINVIAYMHSLSENPIPLPEPIAVPAPEDAGDATGDLLEEAIETIEEAADEAVDIEQG